MRLNGHPGGPLVVHQGTETGSGRRDGLVVPHEVVDVLVSHVDLPLAVVLVPLNERRFADARVVDDGSS